MNQVVVTPHDQLEVTILTVKDFNDGLISWQSACDGDILSRVRKLDLECSLGFRFVFPNKPIWEHGGELHEFFPSPELFDHIHIVFFISKYIGFFHLLLLILRILEKTNFFFPWSSGDMGS